MYGARTQSRLTVRRARTHGRRCTAVSDPAVTRVEAGTGHGLAILVILLTMSELMPLAVVSPTCPSWWAECSASTSGSP